MLLQPSSAQAQARSFQYYADIAFAPVSSPLAMPVGDYSLIVITHLRNTPLLHARTPPTRSSYCLYRGTPSNRASSCRSGTSRRRWALRECHEWWSGVVIDIPAESRTMIAVSGIMPRTWNNLGLSQPRRANNSIHAPSFGEHLRLLRAIDDDIRTQEEVAMQLLLPR